MKTLKDILPDLIALTIGLVLAWTFQWQATDLIWSLWLGSLVLGYATIVSTIAGGVGIGLAVARRGEFESEHKSVWIAGGSLLAIFMLGFFSFHFCAFHAGHAVFLSGFFPIEGLEPKPLMAAFMNPFALWSLAVTHVFPLYGWFLIPMLIAERHSVFKAFRQSLGLVRKIGDHRALSQADITAWREARKSSSTDGKSKSEFGQFLSAPYVNVMKMHALIFVLFGCKALALENFMVYSIVAVVYFVPWRAIAFSLKSESAS